MVDDSIGRGNTSRQIVDMVRKSGAKKVYFASCAPPLTHPCVYGVDIPTKKELIAGNKTVAEIASSLGVDGLFYQDVEDLKKSISVGNPKIKHPCMACFTGTYPTPEVTEATLAEAERLRGCETLKDHAAGELSLGNDVSEDQMSMM